MRDNHRYIFAIFVQYQPDIIFLTIDELFFDPAELLECLVVILVREPIEVMQASDS